jgi:hypothetical protein
MPFEVTAYARTKYFVSAVSCVSVLVKFPVPDPFIVFVVRLVSGLAVVAQQIPLFKMGEPPFVFTVPPPVAEIPVMSVIELASMVITVSSVSFLEQALETKKAITVTMQIENKREFMR